ncbi:MAG: periplasmic heavy metal sensor [Kiritimatiellaeota bacterium]|nr:periplasmic heavy metal sensor [Kiritimatiellota bacterium]
MNQHILLAGLVVMAMSAPLVWAKPDRAERPNHAARELLKPAKPAARSLYLDYDPNIVFVIGKTHHQFGLTVDQLRQLHELVLKFQNEMPKEREVAQQAREELEKVMSTEKPDEAVIQKISDRAIMADSALQRGRLQFWIELRQRFGKDVFEKVQQTIFRHQHGIEDATPKSANEEIFPAQKPELPAKD